MPSSQVQLEPEELLAQTSWLRRLVVNLVGDSHSADDVLQDTMVVALQRPPAEVASEGRLRGWLARVAQNAARMRSRSDRRRLARERSVARAELHVDAVADEAIAAQARLLEALAALPARDREVVVLRYYENLPPREIAARLGTTSDAVRSRLTRALGSLRGRLVPSGDRRRCALLLAPLLRGTGESPVPASTLTWSSMAPAAWIMKASTKTLLGVLALGLGLSVALLLDSGTDLAADGANETAPARAAWGLAAAAGGAGDTLEAERVAAAGDPDPQRTEVVQPAAVSPPAAPRGEFEVTVVARCVTAAGDPIAGATLLATDIEGQPSVETDAGGRATLVLQWPPKLTTGNEHWVVTTVTGDGLTRVQQQSAVQGRLDQTVTLGDIVLGPGGDVAGTVLDRMGKPVAGAGVFVVGGCEPTSGVAEETRRVRGRGFPSLGLGPSSWARTDSAGRYVLRGLPVANISVVARRAGYLCGYTEPFDVRAAGEVTAPNVRLDEIPARNRIAGTVVDAAGSPVASASLGVFKNRGPRNIDAMHYGRTDAEGQFELAVLSGQQYSLEVEHRGGGRRQALVHDVAAGTTDVVVRFEEERPFHVEIVSTDGSPVEVVRAWAVDETGNYLELAWREGEDGKRVPLAPAQPFTLWADARGHRRGHVGPFDPAALPERIELRLEPASVVSGVVTAGGEPVGGAKIDAHFIDPRHDGVYTFAHEIYTRLDAAAGPETVTDSEGRFALPLTRSGSYVLQAEAEGYGRGESLPVVVEQGSTSAPVSITVERPASIEGTVLTADGVSAEGQIVAATKGDGHVEVCVTDAAGKFRFTGLAPGGWQVRSARPDDQQWLRQARTWPVYEHVELPVDLTLSPGQAAIYDVDLRSRYAAKILGRLSVDGIESNGFRVSVFCDGVYELVDVGSDGSFRHRTSSGQKTLYCLKRLSHGGRLSIRKKVDLVEGDNALEVGVRTGSVELLGLPASARANEEAPGWGYALVWEGDGGSYTFDPDASGGHRAAALPVGRAELRRREDEWQRVEEGAVIATVEILAGQMARVVLQ